MAVTWKEVAGSDRFKGLMDGDREKIRTAFFKDEVMAKLPKEQHQEAANQFYTRTQDDVMPPEAITPDDSIPEIMGSKGVGAFLVGMGAGMRDIYDGAKQVFAIGEEQLDKEREYFAQLKESEEYGGITTAGQITGFLAEPVGLLIPAAKGKSLFQVAKTGAITGAAFGAMGYVAEGQNRLTNTVLGGVMGGTLSPLFVGLGRGLSKSLDIGEARASTFLVNKLEDKVHQFQAAGASPSLAMKAAKRFYSLSDDDVMTAITKTERGKIKLAKNQMDASRIMESKLSNNFDPDSLSGKVKLAMANAATATGNKAGNILTPIASRISRISPKLGGSLRKMEFESHREIANAFKHVNPFTDSYKGLSKSVRESLKKPLLSGDFDTVKAILKEQRGGDKMIKEFDEVGKVLNRLYGKLRKVGYDIPKIENYWPRVVANPDGVTRIEHSIIQKEFDRMMKLKGRGLTIPEQRQAVKHLFSPGMQEKVWGKTSASLKQRKFHSIDEELMPHYADPIDALNHYIHQNIQDVSRRTFMSRHGYKGKPNLDGSDLEDSIEAVIVKQREQGIIDINDEATIVEALKARFGPGEKAPNQFIQFMKNSTYAVTLGNPISATTQFGDLVFAAHKNGIVNTVSTLFGKKLVKKEMLGLMDAVEELASDRNFMKKVADWSFKWGGFNRVDRLGKETFVNSALKKYNKLAKKNPDAIRKQWGEVFGIDETESLIRNLNNKELTDNVKLLLWNELSDVQPISLSEMPLKYLQHPDGRVLYTLKTFTVKQLDFMRKQIIDEYAAGNRAQAAVNAAKFSALFVAANSTVDAAKDVLKGKEINIEDHVVDNIWTLVGTNKYTYKEATQKGIGTAAIHFVAPPLNVFDDFTRGFNDPKRWWNLLPPYGKMIANWSKSDRDKYFEFTDMGKDFEGLGELK